MKDSVEAGQLAVAWIAMHLSPQDSDEYEANFWAYEQLAGLCENDPDKAWDVVNSIRATDGSDRILANLAAGPVETLLTKFGDQVVDRILNAAKHDQQLRRILGAVWKGSIPDTIWMKIKEVASPSW